jgi:hypothetical protein
MGSVVDVFYDFFLFETSLQVLLVGCSLLAAFGRGAFDNFYFGSNEMDHNDVPDSLLLQVNG